MAGQAYLAGVLCGIGVRVAHWLVVRARTRRGAVGLADIGRGASADGLQGSAPVHPRVSLAQQAHNAMDARRTVGSAAAFSMITYPTCAFYALEAGRWARTVRCTGISVAAQRLQRVRQELWDFAPAMQLFMDKV